MFFRFDMDMALLHDPIILFYIPHKKKLERKIKDILVRLKETKSDKITDSKI